MKDLSREQVENLVKALLVKYGTRQGEALVGGGTLTWSGAHVELRIDRDGDALRLHWSAPPLNGGSR